MVGEKRGEMTLATIIAIVLGITVLVFLIFGFTTGWNNMWEQVMGTTTGSNVQLKIADCENDCRANEKSAWCEEKKDLRFFDDSGDIVKITGNCDDFSNSLLTFDGKVAEGEIKSMGFLTCSDVQPC